MHQDISDTAVDIAGFDLLRMNRTEASGKQHGGAVCIYTNTKWCNNTTVKLSSCSENLSVICRPYYLPREISCVLLVAVYVPGRGDHSVAKNLISELVITHPDAAVLLMGDFNWCDMDRHLPGYHQFVNFSTRESSMLDLFYCNVKNSYKAYKQHQFTSRS